MRILHGPLGTALRQQFGPPLRDKIKGGRRTAKLSALANWDVRRKRAVVSRVRRAMHKGLRPQIHGERDPSALKRRKEASASKRRLRGVGAAAWRASARAAAGGIATREGLGGENHPLYRSRRSLRVAESSLESAGGRDGRRVGTVRAVDAGSTSADAGGASSSDEEPVKRRKLPSDASNREGPGRERLQG